MLCATLHHSQASQKAFESRESSLWPASTLSLQSVKQYRTISPQQMCKTVPPIQCYIACSVSPTDTGTGPEHSSFCLYFSRRITVFPCDSLGFFLVCKDDEPKGNTSGHKRVCRLFWGHRLLISENRHLEGYTMCLCMLTQAVCITVNGASLSHPPFTPHSVFNEWSLVSAAETVYCLSQWCYS